MSESIRRTEDVPAKAWVTGLAGWAIPGAGHLLNGRPARGLLLGGLIWALYLLGLRLGGHLFGVGDSDAGLLAYVFGFFDMGMGALYFVAVLMDFAVREQANSPTSEYGNVFLMVAGLLNYLLALDAFDIGARRKP